MTKLRWRDVFCFRRMGTIDMARDAARRELYPYYSFNDWVYQTSDENYQRLGTVQQTGLE